MRIIGGRVGGRTLKTPKGSNTRPTSDKVRGAIFNMLMARGDPPPRVLDLYAGSGAMGLEAVSRGAHTALFVETDRDTCDLIRANADALALAAEVKCSPVVRWINKEAGGTFGWIFLDPPYASHETGELDKALELIAKKGLCDPDGGLVVAEHDWRNPPDDRYGPLALLDRRRYGQTAVSMYRIEERNG